MIEYCPNCGRRGMILTKTTERTPEGRSIKVEYWQCFYCFYREENNEEAKIAMLIILIVIFVLPFVYLFITE